MLHSTTSQGLGTVGRSLNNAAPNIIAPRPLIHPSSMAARYSRSEEMSSIQNNSSIGRNSSYAESLVHNAVAESFGSSSDVRNAVRKLYCAASNLQRATDSSEDASGTVNCLVTCTNHESISLYPIHSRLLFKLLDASNPRSTITGQALMDAFIIAHRAAFGRSPRHTDEDETPLSRLDEVAHFLHGFLRTLIQLKLHHKRAIVQYTFSVTLIL